MVRCVYLLLVCVAQVAFGKIISVRQMGDTIDVTELDIEAYKREVSDTCKDGYEKLTLSTMCATDSPNYVAGSAGVSDADKIVIVDRHNFHRRAVSPTATKMMKMYWDEKLARLAEKWARQCYIGHDDYVGFTRRVPDYGINPGQNGGFNPESWLATVNRWHSEVNIFKWGVNPETYLQEKQAVGHYTQVVKDTALLVGCGYAECKDTTYSKYYFCNYITGQSNVAAGKPYKDGKTCADCPKSCKDKLCDCKGVFCANGGTLDVDTCTCTCKTPLFSGPKCLTNACPNTFCKNGGKVEMDPCRCLCTYPFTGPECGNKQCTGKLDIQFCAGYKAEQCKKISNLKDYCPVLCGVCPS